VSPVSLLAGPDAAWLHMDRPDNLMVVNTVVWTDAPVDWSAVRARLAAMVVPRFPTLRRRVVDPEVPFAWWQAPAWVDVDPDLDAHVRRVRLPVPGDAAALQAYVAAEATRPLVADRPLWELHAIDGFGRGSAALLRTHHAVADGTGVMAVIEAVADAIESGGATPSAPPGSPSVLSSSGARPPLADEWGAALRRWRTGTGVDNEVLARLVAAVPGPAVVFNEPLSGVKHVRWSAPVRLSVLRAAGRAAGATVNDVALAVVAGGLGCYLDTVPAEPVLAVVPVNLRPPDEAVPASTANRFGLVFVPLPVDAGDAGERVRRAKAVMDEAKATAEAQLVYDALVVLGRTPAGAARRWVDAFARRASLVVTNVRGPDRPMRLGGAAVAGLVLVVPATGPTGVGFSLCTHAGTARIGLVVDDAVVPDPDALQAAVDEELAALL
jgi:diacylglycerol O-acyltransferase